MRVLSLFDGISCGLVALNRAKIKVTRYVSSEIDPQATEVSKYNWSNVEYVGDVSKLNFKRGEFDLILAGSPCQGFSRAGLGNAFEDKRSSLYYEFLRIKNKVRPKWFLLENVKMHPDYINKINNDLGCECIEINSRLVAPQNRERLYWTNIPFKYPKDKNFRLQDLVGKYKGIWVWPRGSNPGGVQDYKGVAPCVTTSSWEYNFRLVLPNNKIRMFTSEEIEQLQTLPPGYTACAPKSKRSKLVGNGWTVDVISSILSGIPK